jgi:hypothetical protein
MNECFDAFGHREGLASRAASVLLIVVALYSLPMPSLVGDFLPVAAATDFFDNFERSQIGTDWTCERFNTFSISAGKLYYYKNSPLSTYVTDTAMPIQGNAFMRPGDTFQATVRWYEVQRDWPGFYIDFLDKATGEFLFCLASRCSWSGYYWTEAYNGANWIQLSGTNAFGWNADAPVTIQITKTQILIRINTTDYAPITLAKSWSELAVRFRVYSYSSGSWDYAAAWVDNLKVVHATGPGRALLEYWEGIPGTAISSMTSYAYYPDKPNGRDFPESLRSVTNPGDNYGTRMRAFVHPPATGNYTFTLAGADSCELWLSVDENPANKTKIAWVGGQSQSSPISLVSGKKYYLEALQKAGVGSGDNVSVGWQGPSGIDENPICGSRISRYDIDEYMPWIVDDFGRVSLGSNWVFDRSAKFTLEVDDKQRRLKYYKTDPFYVYYADTATWKGPDAIIRPGEAFEAKVAWVENFPDYPGLFMDFLDKNTGAVLFSLISKVTWNGGRSTWVNNGSGEVCIDSTYAFGYQTDATLRYTTISVQMNATQMLVALRGTSYAPVNLTQPWSELRVRIRVSTYSNSINDYAKAWVNDVSVRKDTTLFQRLTTGTAAYTRAILG